MRPEVLGAALRAVEAHLSGSKEQTEEKPRWNGFIKYKAGAGVSEC